MHSDVEVAVALLVEAKVLEDVNVDVEFVGLLEDAKVSEMDVLVLILIVKMQSKMSMSQFEVEGLAVDDLDGGEVNEAHADSSLPNVHVNGKLLCSCC